MPRPHSPDCLLWAKNLKDEHIKLKMRMTDLENANEKRAADAKELKSNVDGITALKHDLGDLGKRVGDIEDDDQEFKNLNDGVVEDLKKRIVGQERKLEDLTSKLSSFVRTNDDLQEEQTRLRKSYDNLATDLKKLEKLISKSTSNAGQLARKNDPNDLRTLHSIVESIQHKQIDEIAMIQTLDARMMQLERSGQRMGPPSIPAKTPSVQETSSPAVLVPASPLAQKSARRYEKRAQL